MLLRYGKRIEPFALRPLEQDRFINVLYGAVRSGKTTALLPKMMQAIYYPARGWRVIVGYSKTSIYRNVLHDFFTLLGPSRYTYNIQTGMLRVMHSDWMVIGAGDEGSEKAIRGMTVGVAFVDELTRIPESFYQMLVNRLTDERARLYATTNPDHPEHWVRKNILEKPALKQAGDVYALHCTMDDNPSLSETYKQRMKRQYRGAFYRRFILGEWVGVEGSVYGDFWSEALLFDRLPYHAIPPKAHVIGLDYGTTNPLAALEGIDDGETLWITREYYYDSKERQRQMTDDEYVRQLERWVRRSVVPDPRPLWLIDPSAASFKLRCAREGWWVKDADNDVMAGIRDVSCVMASRKLRIHRSCENLIRELQAYTWDDSGRMRGVEKPRKTNDHACDAMRYLVREVFKPWKLEA
jgi:PBSX family phage terminase large subunit